MEEDQDYNDNLFNKVATSLSPWMSVKQLVGMSPAPGHHYTHIVIIIVIVIKVIIIFTKVIINIMIDITTIIIIKKLR